MQRNDTACRSGAPEISSTLPAATPPTPPPETSTNRVQTRSNVLKATIGGLVTLSAFGALADFVPMAAMELTCSIVLYLANNLVDGQFNRGRNNEK